MQKGKIKPSKNKLEKEKHALQDYAKYSNLAFKLIAIILLPFFLGLKMDQWIHTGFPLFTLLLSISGLVAILYMLIKDRL